MPTHPGHPAIASTTLVSASRSLLNDAFDSVSLQTVTATATLNPDDGRYVLVAPASHATITLPDPASDERYQNVRLVLKRTTAGVYTATVVVAGGGLIDGSSSTTLNAQYDCEVLFSDGTAWHRLRDQTNLLAPDYLDFGDWIVGTDDSNPAPVATSDAYTAPDGTTTADELEWDNTTELADESWAEPGASVLEAGDGAEYSFYIDSEVGDGIKTVLEVEDTSVPGLLEQTTVAFSNVFAEERYTSYAPGSDPAGYYLSVGNWARVGDWTVASSAYSPPVDISSPFDFESITASGGGKRIVGDIGTESYIPGQEVTVSLWIYKPSFSTNVGNITWWFSLRDALGTDVERILVYINTSGEIASISGVTSGGPGYTASNATRLQAHASDSDWAKLSIRLRDYSGTATRTQIMFGYNATLGQKFTIAQPSFYLGDHVSSQQLLTVDDGVENILNSVGIFDAADFDDLPNNVASEAISAIAAPDGTLTAIETVSTSPTVQHNVSVLAFETTGTYTQLGSLWKDGVAWTGSVYVYMGQPNAARMAVVLQVRDTAGVAQDSVSVTIVDGSVNSVSTISSGSVAYSEERNVDLSPIGNSGWYRCSITIQDHTVTCDRIYFYLYGTSGSSYDRFITWSPALRYGDWVARGKNWLTNGDEGPALEDWDRIGSTLERSTVAALDGTLSAWDLTSGNASAFLRQENISGLPDGGRFQFTLYFYGIDSASASTLRLQVWQRNSGGSLSEYMRGYVNVDPDLLTLSVDNVITSGPGYTTDFLSVEAVGNNWFKWTVTWQDYGNDYNYAQFELSYYGSDPVTIWNPRLTVGNPADARGYFVSGPQNLLGDGSDYTSGYWTKDASVTISANAQVAPNGRLEADDITRAVDADDFRVFPAILGSLITGKQVRYVFYVKPPSGLGDPTEQIELYLADDPFTTIYERVVFNLDYSSPAVPVVGSFSSTTTGGPGYTANDVTITPISNGWSRIQVDLFDYSGTAERVVVRHFGRFAANGGSAYTVSYWGSEVTTLDRTPTANELRPVSNGVVDFDAYPPEHRSLFADLEDAGDNWYKVTTKITDI